MLYLLHYQYLTFQLRSYWMTLNSWIIFWLYLLKIHQVWTFPEQVIFLWVNPKTFCLWPVSCQSSGETRPHAHEYFWKQSLNNELWVHTTHLQTNITRALRFVSLWIKAPFTATWATVTTVRVCVHVCVCVWALALMGSGGGWRGWRWSHYDKSLFWHHVTGCVFTSAVKINYLKFNIFEKKVNGVTVVRVRWVGLPVCVFQIWTRRSRRPSCWITASRRAAPSCPSKLAGTAPLGPVTVTAWARRRAMTAWRGRYATVGWRLHRHVDGWKNDVMIKWLQLAKQKCGCVCVCVFVCVCVNRTVHYTRLVHLYTWPCEVPPRLLILCCLLEAPASPLTHHWWDQSELKQLYVVIYANANANPNTEIQTTKMNIASL